MINDLINGGQIQGVTDLTYHNNAYQGLIVEGGMNITSYALRCLGDVDYKIYIQGNVIRFAW